MLLRKLQEGIRLSLPYSRPMPSIGPRCHELQIPDIGATWRIIYRFDPHVVVIVEVFSKKTQQTPQHVIESCRRRLRQYDALG